MRAEHDQPNHAILRDATGTARDRLMDNARDGSKIVRKEDCGFEMDFSPTTLEEEISDGGWNRIQQPVPSDPADGMTSGGRGEANRDYDTAHRDGHTYPW